MKPRFRPTLGDPGVVPPEDNLERLEASVPEIGIDPIELLIDALKEDTVKFNVTTDPVVADVIKWRNFRRGNKTALQAMHQNWKSGRPYKFDPLPKRIAKAFADFTANTAPLVTPAEESDRSAMTTLLRESKFASKFRWAVDTMVSEREVWCRIYTDPWQSFWPILEWHSRLDVRPYMYGDRVLSVAFVTPYGQIVKDGPHYHHLEIHADKRVVNMLFKGEEDQLGVEVPLTEHPLTSNLEEEWNHGLPMLARQIKNGPEMVSVYDGLEDLFLDLNEAHVIDAENFRLAGKKRAAIPRKYKDQAGDMNSGEEIIWTEDDWDEMEAKGDIIKVMEYEYDGEGSKMRKDDLERVILTRAGLSKQLVDADSNEGLAQTGTALRTRLIPGLASIEGTDEELQGELPIIISLLARVDALEEGSGGWGRTWLNAAEPPAVIIRPPIPEDPSEEAQRHQTLVTSNLESVEKAVQEMHPEWSVEQRLLEVNRILANKAGYALDDDGKPIYPNGQGATPPTPGSGLGDVQPPGGGGAQSPPVTPGSAGAGVGAGI